mmetsp:Transcript_151264/g.263634  ORF Transcript_151264/g.263634 Transcript_151264/m.263634 type:complete len:296 (+) Transcript_151264:1752-2639(+)
MAVLNQNPFPSRQRLFDDSLRVLSLTLPHADCSQIDGHGRRHLENGLNWMICSREYEDQRRHTTRTCIGSREVKGRRLQCGKSKCMHAPIDQSRDDFSWTEAAKDKNPKEFGKCGVRARKCRASWLVGLIHSLPGFGMLLELLLDALKVRKILSKLQQSTPVLLFHPIWLHAAIRVVCYIIATSRQQEFYLLLGHVIRRAGVLEMAQCEGQQSSEDQAVLRKQALRDLLIERSQNLPHQRASPFFNAILARRLLCHLGAAGRHLLQEERQREAVHGVHTSQLQESGEECTSLLQD